MRQKKEERELEQHILSLADLLIENLIATSMLNGDNQEQQLGVSIEIVAKIANLLEQYLGDFNEHFETLLQQLAQQKLPDENVLTSFGDFQSLLDTAIKEGLILYQKPSRPLEDYDANPDTNVKEEQISADATNDIEEEIKFVEENQMEVESGSEEKYKKDSVSKTGLEEESNPENNLDLIVNSEDDRLGQLDVTESIVAINLSETDKSSLEDNFMTVDEETVQLEPEATDNEKIWDLALRQVFPNVEKISNYAIKKNVFSYYLPEFNLVIDKFNPDKKETIWKEFYSRQNNLTYLKIDTNENNSLRQLIRSLKRNFAEKKY